MNKEQALGWLQQHQPLPPDDALTEELIAAFREVMDYCHTTHDADCIPLLLNVFGDGDGWGNYQYVDEVLWRYPTEKVLPHLKQSLQSERRSVRYWSAEIAAIFPYSELIALLQPLLLEADEDMRSAAIGGIAFIEDIRVEALLTDCLHREAKEHIREQIEDILKYRQTPEFHITARRWRKEEEWPEMMEP